MEELRVSLNEKLYLGLFDYECHYAIYGAGAHYEKHLDALAGQKNRLLSTVVYLNSQWAAADGGEAHSAEAVRHHMLQPELRQPPFQ